MRIVYSALFLAACAGPQKLVRVPIGSVLLVIDGGGATLESLNPQTGFYDRYYPVAEGPSAVTVSPDGRRAVVASFGSSQLTVVSVLDRRVERQFELPGRPRGVVFLNRQRAAVPIEGGELLVVRLLAQNVARSFDVGVEQPRGISLSRDRKRAYVPDAASDQLVAVDLETGTVLGRVPLGRGPTDVLRRPYSEELWVTCRDEGSVIVVAGESLEVAARIEVGGAPVGLGFDRKGRWALVADAAGGTVIRIDAGTREVVASVDLGSTGGEGDGPGWDGTPAGVLVEPSGRYAFAPLVHADRVAVIDVAGNALLGTYPTGPAPIDLAWTWINFRDPFYREGEGNGD